MQLETVKIKNAAEEGGFIIINKSDFNADEHELFDAESGSKLTVSEIKKALEANGIAIPDGVTKKADLQKLLDGSA